MALCRQVLQAGLQRQFSASHEDAAQVLHAATQLLAQAMLLAGGRMGRAAARLREAPAGPLVAAAAQPGQPHQPANQSTTLVVNAAQLCGSLVAALPAGCEAGQAAALRLLPLAAAIVQELVPPAARDWLAGGASSSQPWHRTVALMPLALSHKLLAQVQPIASRSGEELLHCCAAADAALSMLHVAAQLVADAQALQAADAQAGRQAEACLSDLLIVAKSVSHLAGKLWEDTNFSLATSDAQSSGMHPVIRASLAQAQVQLHARACRLVHWLCAQSAELLPQAIVCEPEAAWTWLLERLVSTFLSANDAVVERRMATEQGSDEFFAAR